MNTNKISLTTLCYIEQDDKYLMMHRVKKENDLNKDKWVGVGGHFEAGESPEECLLREVKEETGLTLTSYRFRGIVTFVSNEWPEAEYMCLYTADGFEGEVHSDVAEDCEGESCLCEGGMGACEEIFSCPEGTLEWVPKDKVMDLPIWEGDKIFFKLLAEERAFFSLKLCYEGNRLVEAILDGEALM